MVNFLKNLADGAVRLLLSVEWYDIIDIGLVAFAVFYAIKFIRKTRAFSLVKGLIFMGFIYIIVSLFHMSTSSFIFNQLFSDIVLVVILIFQPEIRNAVEGIGNRRLKKPMFFSLRSSQADTEEIKAVATAISKSVYNMSDTNTGALIVIEGNTPLGHITSTGNELDASVTATMLESIFFPKAPMHDGAVIISKGRIHSAGCILPLSSAPMNKALGTRHRAALGASEESDAMVLVVSEETGNISVAKDGRLNSTITRGELLEEIISYLSDNSDTDSRSFKLLRRKNNERK